MGSIGSPEKGRIVIWLYTLKTIHGANIVIMDMESGLDESSARH